MGGHKHKLILRATLILGVGLVGLVILAIAVLNSRAFHRYVLAEMDAKASQATGARVEIGDFGFNWRGLRANLYRIVLHGSEAAGRPPLLQVDQLGVGLKIISLWRRKIDLNEIVLDRPALHMDVDRNGATNLPSPPPSKRGSRQTTIFELAIGRFVVNQGELDYRDRHIPLDGEVRDLQAQVTFDAAKNEYDGSLGYRNGRIQFAGLSPIEHGVQVDFGATAAGLTLNSLVLNAGASTISAQARVQNYSGPSVDGSYQAAVSTAELGKILKASPFPAGQVDLQGTVHYEHRPDRPLLDNLATNGEFRSALISLDLPQARASVRAFRGDYRLADGTLEARKVQGDVLGGRVAGELTLTHLADQPAATIAATVRDISLDAASNALTARPLNGTTISGLLNGAVQGSWVGGGENLELHTDATIAASAPVRQASGSGARPVPLRGDLHLAYDGRSGVITIKHSMLATPHLSASIDGSTSGTGKQSSLAIQAHSDDLREVDQLVLTARYLIAGSSSRQMPSKSSGPFEPFGLGGSASVDGQLYGSLNDLHVTARLASTELQYRGTDLKNLQANVALSPSQATVSQGEFQTSDQGEVHFDVSAGLTHWAYRPKNPVRLDLNAEKVHVATLQQLADLHYPVTGTVSAHISGHGTQANIVGQGTVTLAQAMAWNQPIQNLGVQFSGAGNTIHTTLQLSAPAGSGSGTLAYDFHNQGYDGQFTLPRIQLEKLGLIEKDKVQVGGVVAVSLQGKGTLKNPQLAATVQAPKLLVGQQAVNGFKIQANVAQQRATFTLASAAEGASLQAQGAVALNANYDATATVNVKNIQLGVLLAAFLPETPAGLHGQAELHGSLHGPLKQRERVEAEVEIPTLNLAYQDLQIGNATPIHAVYRGGVISLDQCKLRGTGTEVQVHATIPMERGQSLQAAVTGTVDLHLARLLYPDLGTSGQIRLDVGAQGTFLEPGIQGSVRLVDATMEPAGAPLGVQKVNATLAVKNGRVDIQDFTGEAGGGALTAQGFATFQPAMQFNVSLNANRVRLRYPLGTRAILNSHLVLAGTRDSALLNGQVLIDRLSLTKQFDVSTFADQFSGNSAASPSPGFAQHIKLNVSVMSATEMAVSSSKLSIQGSANLVVRGTAAQPVILGRTDITDGEIFFNGQRYTVQSGVVQFVNVTQTEPVVNLHVTTTVDQFNVTLNVVGPADRMRVTYTSDPPLAPIDIINLLASGKTTEAASANPTSPESMIAGQLTSQFSNRLEKLVGISSLTIDPQVGAGQGNGSGTMAIQQRVTKNLFFTFSTNLTNSTGQVVQVEYQVSRRFAVSTLRDQNGGYTVQVKVHKSF